MHSYSYMGRTDVVGAIDMHTSYRDKQQIKSQADEHEK
jgi:hypothetical protein